MVHGAGKWLSWRQQRSIKLSTSPKVPHEASATMTQVHGPPYLPLSLHRPQGAPSLGAADTTLTLSYSHAGDTILPWASLFKKKG